MGIFGRHEIVQVIDPDRTVVDAEIASRLPDPGVALMELLSFLHEDSLHSVLMELDRVRGPDGSIPLGNLDGIGIHDWKNGPLTHLIWLTAKDRILVSIWASFGLGRQERRRIESTVEQLVETHGIATAATWAIQSRPNSHLDVDSLATQLVETWNEAAGQICNGDIIKSFKKWRR